MQQLLVYFQFESLMQLVSLICSAFKDVFKASIAEKRTTSNPSNQTNPSNPVNPPNPVNPTDEESDFYQVFEALEDALDDKRKTPDCLKEVLSLFNVSRYCNYK